MWALEMKIRKGAKDPAFGNTTSFGVKLGVGIILFFIYTPLAFCLAPWWLALSLILLWMPTYSFLHDYIEGCRRWISDIKLIFNRQLRDEFHSIVNDFKQI
jgi:cell division protein FtsW (lipid II flippase)